MNIITKKHKYIITVLGFVISAIFTAVFFINKISAASYVATEAVIVGITSDRGVAPTPGGPESNEVEYVFEVSGQNIYASKPVFSTNGKSIGKVELVRYDPLKPDKLEDTYMEAASIVCALFSATFSVLLLISIKLGRF